MTWWNGIRWRLRAWFRPHTVDREIRDETRFHIEMRAREYRSAGVPAAEARSRALARFGRLNDYESSLCRIRNVSERARHRGDPMDKLLQDIRYALRTVARNPGFAATAVFTLSLGIGANLAIFSITNTMLLKPMPYPESEDLVLVWEQVLASGFSQMSLAAPNYVDWRAEQKVFTDIAAYRNTSFTLLSGGDPERVDGLRASAAMFEVLGVDAAHGRYFSQAEDRPGADKVVVLGHGLWQRRFGADPAIVGETVVVDGQAHAVLGVMPPDFDFAGGEEMWVPLALEYDPANRRSHNLDAVARLLPGVSLEQATTELAGIAARLAVAYPESNGGYGVFLQGLREDEIGDEKILVYVLSGVVGFVLLIACANVANLMLARSTARRQELAVRRAMGAGRVRLLRQLLTESILLATIGGLIGIFWGVLGKNMIVGAFPTAVPVWMNWDFDAAVYGFLVGVTLLTGLIFGFVPALQSSGAAEARALNGTGRASGGRRKAWMRGSLVVAEVALALVLLIGAGLMMRAYLNVKAIDPGFDTDNLLLARVALPETDYPEPERRAQFFRDLAERIGALPGVERAAATSLVPVGSFSGTYLGIEGAEPVAGATLPVVSYTVVTSGYFAAMGIPLLEGRLFTESDGAEGTLDVLLVTREAVERFWPDSSALGKRVKFGPTDNPESSWKTIVGVVDDVMQTGLNDPLFPGVYVPVRQAPASRMTLAVRTTSSPESVAGAVREQVWQLDDNLAVFQIRTMAERMSMDDWEEKLFTFIFATFAVVALVLASVGLYGLVSYSVAQRAREIGIRMALGADRNSVVGMVVGQGMTLVGIGLVIGLVGAFGVTRVIASLLVGVSPTDPATFGGIVLTLALVAFAASYLPARRATRVDPVRALREQ